MATLHVDPYDDRSTDADTFLDGIADTPAGWRLGIALFLLPLGAGVSACAWALLEEFSRSWIAWAITLLIVEPIGLALIIMGLVLLAPDSLFAHFLRGAMRRAGLALALLGLALLSFVVGTIVYVIWQFATL